MPSLRGSLIGAEIKTSLWLVEVWNPETQSWKVETVEQLEKYAESFYRAMRSRLAEGEIRKRRFVAEGQPTRGQPVRNNVTSGGHE